MMEAETLAGLRMRTILQKEPGGVACVSQMKETRDRIERRKACLPTANFLVTL